MIAHAFPPGNGNVPDDAHPDIIMLVRYWQYIHPEGRLPGCAHFNLDEIAVLRPNMRLLDVVPGTPCRYRVRMIGEAHVRQLGFDPTGRWYDSLASRFSNSVVELDLARVCHHAEPVYRKGPTIVPYTSGAEIIERVHVPLASDGATVDCIASLTLFFTSLQPLAGPRPEKSPVGGSDGGSLVSPERTQALDDAVRPPGAVQDTLFHAVN